MIESLFALLKDAEDTLDAIENAGVPVQEFPVHVPVKAERRSLLLRRSLQRKNHLKRNQQIRKMILRS